MKERAEEKRNLLIVKRLIERKVEQDGRYKHKLLSKGIIFFDFELYTKKDDLEKIRKKLFVDASFA